MASKGIFDDLGDFISAGGHVESAIMLGGATGIGRVKDYVRRHVPSITDDGLQSFLSDLLEARAAATTWNQLESNQSIDPSIVPTFPTQFGDDRQGRRVIGVFEVFDPETGQFRIVRTETEDFYTRDEMQQLLDLIINSWKSRSPGRFNGMFDSEIEQEGFRQLYTFKAF